MISNPMEWISIEDRLPNQGEPVLLYQTYPVGSRFNCLAYPIRRTFITVGGLTYNGKFVASLDQFCKEGLKHVSHWTPIPSPPKNE